MMPALKMSIDQYGQSHRNTINRLFHFVGIPTIGIGLLGLLAKLAVRIDLPAFIRPNLAWLVLVLMGWWYLSRDRQIGLATFAIVLLFYLIGTMINAPILWAIFGFGIVAHIIGHFGFEHKPPALFSHPRAVLAAPAWLLSLGLGMK